MTTPPPSDPSVFDLTPDDDQPGATAAEAVPPVRPRHGDVVDVSNPGPTDRPPAATDTPDRDGDSAAGSGEDPADAATGPSASAESSGLSGPVEFVVDLADHCQIVLLGDQRYVRQHLALLAELIQPLYDAGVTNVAWEFTNTRAQAQLDALVTGPDWNQRACNDLFVDLMGIGFGYQEYADVVKAAWQVNQGRDGGSPPMRIVALGLPSYVEDPDLLDGRSAAEFDLRNWWLGGHYRDITAFHMANVLTTEVIRKGERAVVYADAARTTTRLTEWHDGEAANSLGNLLHRWMGEGVRRVLFHGAVPDTDAIERVEALIAAAPEDEPQFGIDLDRSTLGNVGVGEVTGCIGGVHTEFRLGDIADGYLFVAARDEWEPVSLIDGLITPGNLVEAERRYRALDPRPDAYTLDELEGVREDGLTDLPSTWPALPEADPEPEAKKRWFRRG